jgi:hypothetical protein
LVDIFSKSQLKDTITFFIGVVIMSAAAAVAA